MKLIPRLAAWFLGVALSFGGIARVVDAQLTRTDSAEFVRTTQSLLDAITNGDTTVWAVRLSRSWFMTDEEGRHLTRAEFLRELRPLPSGQMGELRLADWHLVGTPATAVMSYAIDEAHDFYGQHLRTRFRATDTWVREDGEWRMPASQVTALPTELQGLRLSRRLLDSYVGTYALTDSITLEIAADDSSLTLVRARRPAERLRALDERIFVRNGGRGFWVFERDGSGSIVRLVNWRDNNAVVWRRRPRHP